MVDRDSVFVDLDSLNVVIKTKGRITVALSFTDALDRLASILASLSVGYSVYLCLKPLAKGEGDRVIDELSLSGLPFTVNSKELVDVVRFFRNIHGAGDIYICNWIANYIAVARVNNFRSVVYYGSRVAELKVENKLIESFKIYNNQKEYFDNTLDENAAYGDVGLVDVNGLCAKYPELHDLSKATVTAIAPLIECYHTSFKVSFESLVAEEDSALSARNEDATADTAGVDPAVDEVKTQEEVEAPIQQTVEYEHREVEIPNALAVIPTKTKKRSTTLVRGLMVASFVSMFFIGASFGVVSKADLTDRPDSYYESVNNRINYMRDLVQVYTAGPDRGKQIANAVKYCKNSEFNISIVGFEFVDSDYIVRCACASEDVKDSFVEYINKEYFSLETVDLGDIPVGESTMKQFSVRFS